MTSSKPNYLPKALSPNPSPWELGLPPTYDGGHERPVHSKALVLDFPLKQTVHCERLVSHMYLK